MERTKEWSYVVGFWLFDDVWHISGCVGGDGLILLEGKRVTLKLYDHEDKSQGL